MNLRSLTKMSATIGLLLLIGACQTITPSSGTGSVSPESTVPFPEGRNTGRWEGNYLVVDYKYSGTLTDIDMTGTVNFRENLSMNFSSLYDFHLSAIFVDENGKVLGTRGLATARGAFDPIPFHVRLSAPRTTVSLSFSYEGTAIEGGNDEGGGVSRFFQYPIH